jgi:hypothetical protein
VQIADFQVMLGQALSSADLPITGAISMPARKNNKNKTGIELSSLEENVTPSTAAYDQGFPAVGAPSSLPEDPPAWKKLASEMSQSDKDEADEGLILTYLTYYRLLEMALLQAGFVRSPGARKQVQPDWYGWVRHIDKEFDPDSSDELGDSVDYLMGLRDDEEPRPVRTQNRLQWESASAFSQNLWLADMLQQTTMQLTYRYNLPETPGCDAPQVMASLFVVEAWLQLVVE